MNPPRVVVIGAGISGAACAAALRAAGVAVEVRERDAAGGRLASPTLHGRPVDLGAAYVTAKDHDFGAVLARWAERGLAREWTATFDAIDDHGRERKPGPMRWAAPHGLASLAADLLAGVEVVRAPVRSLDDVPGDAPAVVLAMPDPQAAQLAGAAVDAVAYEPVIAVAAGYEQRAWDLDAAAFVNDDSELTLVADDGARRGDGAPVLVAHTTAQLARAHADEPAAATPAVLAALERRVGVDAEPRWTHAVHWACGKPTGTHDAAPFALLGDRPTPLGLCGDSWCPQGAPRVEAAWLSGHRLGTELARTLAG